MLNSDWDQFLLFQECHGKRATKPLLQLTQTIQTDKFSCQILKWWWRIMKMTHTTSRYVDNQLKFSKMIYLSKVINFLHTLKNYLRKVPANIKPRITSSLLYGYHCESVSVEITEWYMAVCSCSQGVSPPLSLCYHIYGTSHILLLPTTFSAYFFQPSCVDCQLGIHKGWTEAPVCLLSNSLQLLSRNFCLFFFTHLLTEPRIHQLMDHKTLMLSICCVLH